MRTVVTLAAVAGLLAVPGVAAASAPRAAGGAPATARLAVKSITGPSCSAGTDQYWLAGDRRSAAVRFGGLGARQPGGEAAGTCLVAVRLTGTKGYSFALDGFWLGGRTAVTRGAAATVVPYVYLEGGPSAGADRLQANGPREYEWAHYARVKNHLSSGCADAGPVTLGVLNAAHAAADEAAAQISTERLLISVDDFRWAPC